MTDRRSDFGRRSSRVRTNRIELFAIGALIVSLALIAGMLAGGSSNAGSGGSAPDSAPLSAGLNDRRLAGQRMIAGFSGHSIPAALKRGIRAGRVGGVILFADNIRSRPAVRVLNRKLQRIRRPTRLRGYRLPIMIDQEGGLVKRISGAPNASAATMGRRGPRFSRSQGKLTGRNLKNAGVNINLAPVLDVARPGGNIAGTDRGFGSTAARVSRTAVPFARGVQSVGIAATAKHFPGLGKASLNTDDAVQKIGVPKAVMRRIDEAPYRSFIDAGGKLVMIGTAIYPAFGPKPAAFEKKIVTGELRSRLGFSGVTVTDALGTVASRSFGGPARVAIAGAGAGMDLLLFTDYRQALKAGEALASRIRSGKLDPGSSRKSVNRILRLRSHLGG